MLRRVIPLIVLVTATSASVLTTDVQAQSSPPATDTVAEGSAGAAAGLPIFVTLGLGYGMRSDDCSTCPSPDNKNSFTGHLGLGKKLGHGLAVGVEASVWRRGHPGPLSAADSTGTPTPTTLSNMLGNASVVFSWQIWHVWVQAGGGMAYGSQDLAEGTGTGTTISTASGLGLGYTVGGGFSVPVAGPLALGFFANWNAGSYDLVSPVAVVKRGADHSYLEMGVGLTLR